MLLRDPLTLLRLLQLSSPALPVGGYSYSEGLESLVESGTIVDAASLRSWLEQELAGGSIRLEGAALLRVLAAAKLANYGLINDWNEWLTALRETAELRQQSWQMGEALLQLCTAFDLAIGPELNHPCNFAIAFGLAAAHWQFEPEATLLAYLFSWSANLVSAGQRLIPLGQTVAQQQLLMLQPTLQATVEHILVLQDQDLYTCSWGVSLASMNHETQYSRLFRS